MPLTSLPSGVGDKIFVGADYLSVVSVVRVVIAEEGAGDGVTARDAVHGRRGS